MFTTLMKYQLFICLLIVQELHSYTYW